MKNYADVLDEVLESAASWATRIYVLDNGSTDGSIEVAERAAARLENVRFLGQDVQPWSFGYYATVYQSAKSSAGPVDWWYRLDADEMAVEDPRPLLAAVAPEHDTVWGSFYCYYFTPDDLEAYERNPAAWLSRPVADRVRWYRNDWAEPRFVRQRRFMRWKHEGWRDGSLNPAPEMVPIRHYRYRSPEQIADRLGLRMDQQAWSFETSEFQQQFTRQIFLPPVPGAPAWHRMLADRTMLDLDDGGPLRPRSEFLPTLPAPHGRLFRAIDATLASTPFHRPVAALLRSARTG